MHTFFLIIRNSALAGVWTEDYKKLTYQDVKKNANLSHLVFLDSSRIDDRLSEPYYPFFWYLLKLNWKIKYIIPETEPGVIASRYSTAKQKMPLFLHMWWLRNWFDINIDPYLGVSNRSRYDALEDRFLGLEFSGFANKLTLYRQKILNHKLTALRVNRKLLKRCAR